ncbi:hypothetical protein [Shewanella surugensis]|uniref:Uncharacterized protein n=1 Tax=Shewanella surugensis TaxID=212020 RepID=A0ABT0LKC3_9GAMM|nr:hypothetical protein [Shewanella surugensis]MCL1127752.1 hypothetical protein [Shewanella surugensis]
MNLFKHLKGESPINGAPMHTFENNVQCIPQHYLTFHHSLESIENIIIHTQYDEKYLVFVCEDDFGIYIQVGIIGYDNYLPHDSQLTKKIVYGRKWRVENNLPTSEIIQTTFLALQKAREHEVRELFTINNNKTQSTPFNCHHDLPLLATRKEKLIKENTYYNGINIKQRLSAWLILVRYNHLTFDLTHLEELENGTFVLELSILGKAASSLPELSSGKIILLLEVVNQNTLYHSLIAKLIELSHRHVAEHFTYRGFARFSQKVDILAVAEISVICRGLHEENQYKSFKGDWSKHNYDIDETRVPIIPNSILSNKLTSLIEQHQPLDGQMPKLNKTLNYSPYQ